jgi:phosphatidyl-myo-inositol dimannoside synthase
MSGKASLGYCAVTHEPGHGGIARVSALLWGVLQTRYSGRCTLVKAAGEEGTPNSWDKLSFSARVIVKQVFHSCDALLFDHLGLARIQSHLPQSIRRPYGVLLHSVEAWSSLSGDRLAALKGASVRIANSHYTARRISEANPGIGPIDVCHLALDPAVLGQTPVQGPADPNPFLEQIRPESVLIVGRMLATERHKGHDQMIRAWPRIIREVKGAQLVIVGRGDDVTRLQVCARNAGVDQHVLFTGPVSDRALNGIYRRVGAFAMPSRGEGFGLVYLEAMACALPCIGSTLDAGSEIIRDGETGFLVDPDNEEQLVGSIIRLLKDTELRSRLGQAGFRRQQVTFSVERFAANIDRAIMPLAQ